LLKKCGLTLDVMRAGESSNRPRAALTILRINGPQLLLPSVFIILIHYICFSDLALPRGSKTLSPWLMAFQRPVSSGSFLLNPVLPDDTRPRPDFRRRFRAFSFFCTSRARPVKIRLISVISG
jgi:hypothetical protein